MIPEKIIDSIKKAIGEDEVVLSVPEFEEQGDYSTNIALLLASKKKKGETNTNPRQLASQMQQKLEKEGNLTDIVEKIEVAGPGFINFFVKKEALKQNLASILEKGEKYGSSEIGKGKTVVVDYSSPNIAKRFSIGHMRSTIIGQALYNLYTFLGYKAVGDNHLGDWGTQFGVLIYMVEREGLDSSKLTIEEWEKIYVDFHKELEEKPELKDEARIAFKRLEEKEPRAHKIWEDAMKTSLTEYDKIYVRLNVKIDHAYGESFYEDKMTSAIEEAKKKGLVKESEGALVVEFPKKYKLPSNILVKSNGTTTYLARDLAVSYFRKETWNPDLQIFEVGVDQKLYFQQVFALAEMMGIFRLDQMKHVAHGFFRFKDGKMSTRKGKTIKLEDVLEEAVKKAEKLGSKGDLAQKVGIGALKWNDLKRNPESEIIFDWDEVLNMEGNSGPYIQYTYARAKSVLAKASKVKDIMGLKDSTYSAEELGVVRKLIHFPEVVEDAAKNYSPNILATYLFELAQTFNTFYNKNKIIGDPNEEFRVVLTSCVSRVLKNGLTLLGIEAPERM